MSSLFQEFRDNNPHLRYLSDDDFLEFTAAEMGTQSEALREIVGYQPPAEIEPEDDIPLADQFVGGRTAVDAFKTLAAGSNKLVALGGDLLAKLGFEDVGRSMSEFGDEQSTALMQGVEFDHVKGAAAGAQSAVSGVGQILQMIGAEDVGRKVREYGADQAEALIKSMSERGQKSASSLVFEDDPDSITGYRLSDNWADATLMGAAMSAPSMLLAAVPGAIITSALQGLAKLGLAGGGGATLGILAGAKTPAGLVEKIIARAPAGVGYGSAEGLVAGAMEAADFRGEVEKTSFKELEKSPVFRALKAQFDGDAEKARLTLAEQAASDVFTRTTLSTGTIGVLTGGGALGLLHNQLTGKAGKEYLKRTLLEGGLVGAGKAVGKGALQEGIQETPQTGAEALIGNIATRDYLDPDKDIWEGVGAQALTGGVIGSFMGGVAGGGGHITTARGATPEELLRESAVEAARSREIAPEGRYLAAATQINAERQKLGLDAIQAAPDLDTAIDAATQAAGTQPVTPEDLGYQGDLLHRAEQFAGAPTIGTPTIGAPTIGTPPAGTPPAGTPTIGTPTIGTPTIGAPPAARGRPTEIVTPDGATVAAEWQVVSAASLRAQMEVGATQPRDRKRATSEVQIESIASAPDYRRTSDSPVMDVGAPTIDASGNVIAGNARLEGITRAHQRGTATDYTTSLLADMQSKGMDPAAAQGITDPVLIRRITDAAFDGTKAAVQSNTGLGLQYSGMELARLDSDRMQGLEAVELDEKGDVVLTDKNRATIGQLFRGYEQTEIAALTDKKTGLSQDGVRRVRNAILHRAYGDTDTLARMIESTDNDTRAVVGALARAAASAVKAGEAIAAGTAPKGLDVTADIVAAVELIASLKARGLTLDQYTKQQKIDTDPVSPRAIQIARFLTDNIRSQKAMGDFLSDIYTQIAAVNVKARTVLDEAPTAPKLQDIISRAAEGEREAAPLRDLEATTEGEKDERLTPKSKRDEREAKQLEREAGGKFKIEVASLRDLEAMAEGAKAELETARKIAAIFGKRIVVVHVEGGEFGFNGVVIPESLPNTIFVNIAANNLTHAVVGHELSHHMEIDAPQVYQDLVEAIATLAPDIAGYRKEYGITDDELSDIGVVKEILGDLMGDNFTKQAFWNKVAKANPTAFERIAKVVINWLKKLVTRANAEDMGGDQWVSDVKAAQNAIAKAVAQYTGKVAGKVAQDTGKVAAADAVHKAANKLKDEAFGQKVFVSRVYEQMSQDGELDGVTLEQFKQVLLELNRLNHIDLARADLGYALDKKNVAASEIANPYGATFHFIRMGGPKFSVVGRKSTTADLHQLDTAIADLAKGKDAEDVRYETGWYKEKDGMWRYEISDDQARITKVPMLIEIFGWDVDLDLGAHQWRVYNLVKSLGTVRLDDLLHHDKLFTAYPMLAAMKVSILPEESKSIADYNKATGTIRISDMPTDKDTLSAILHEVQHGLQSIEGFSHGASIADITENAFNYVPTPVREAALDNAMSSEGYKNLAYLTSGESLMEAREEFLESAVGEAVRKFLISPVKAYVRVLGEVEARNTQERMSMTDAERRVVAPKITQDPRVTDANVIVMMGGKAMDTAPTPANSILFSRKIDADGVQRVSDAKAAQDAIVKERGRVPTLAATLDGDIDALLEEIVATLGEQGEKVGYDSTEAMGVGLRGIYDAEVGAIKLRESYDSPDGIQGKRLPGTSAIMVTGDYKYAGYDELVSGLRNALTETRYYGNQLFVALVYGPTTGNMEYYGDSNEILIRGARVAAYIERSTAQTRDEGAKFSRKKSDIRFSRIKGHADLIVLHNLSEENLLHAGDLGGLAMPSIAITKTSVGFTDFGEISLIAHPDILNARDMRTFAADAYSPRHPTSEFNINSREHDKVRAQIEESLEGLPLKMPSVSDLEDGHRGVERLTRSPAVGYHWLKLQGIAPKPRLRKIAPNIKRLIALAKKEGLTSAWRIDESQKMQEAITKELRDTYQGDTRFFEEDGVTPKPHMMRDRAHKVANLMGMEIDSYRLETDVHKALRPKHRSKAYEAFALDLFNQMNDGRRIFKGVGHRGRRYVPYNLANVMKEMRAASVRGGEGHSSPGALRARFAPELKTKSQIQAARDRILDAEGFEAHKGVVNDTVADAIDKLAPYYKWDAESYMYSNDAMDAIGEGPAGWREAFNLDDTSRKIIGDLITFLKAQPTEYFETKAQRVVHLNEFKAAVVPSDTSAEAIALLKRKGITVTKYKRNDADARNKALEAAGKKAEALFSRRRVTDAEYMAAAKGGNVKKAQQMVDEALANAGAYWHGTPSGDLRGGTSGLHVGTKQAATEALEARIGIPADGKGWGGTREYGKTLLAGREKIRSGQFGKYRETGYNMRLPDSDFYPTSRKAPTVGDNVAVDFTWKPYVRPVLIVGETTNTPRTPMTDSRANATMMGQLKRGRARRGFFYENMGEDAGSVSAVFPDGESVRVKLPDAITRDDAGNIIPLSKRFDPAKDDIRFSRKKTPFYSALEREVKNLRKLANKSGEIKANQAALWIEARQKEGKFKREEVEIVGVQDWLKGLGTEAVSVDAVENFVAQNGVQVEEVMHGEDAERMEELVQERFDAEVASIVDDAQNDYWYENLRDAATERDMDVHDMTRREQDDLLEEVMPREDRWDEVAHNMNYLQDQIREQLEDEIDLHQFEGGPNVELRTRFSQWTEPGGKDYKELALILPGETKFAVPEAHHMSEDANINRLAHIRFDTRHIATEASKMTRADKERRRLEIADRASVINAEIRDLRDQHPDDIGGLDADRQRINRDGATGAHMDRVRSLDNERTSTELEQRELNSVADVPDAPGTSLFIQEFQSDWAQQGREKGFAPRGEAAKDKWYVAKKKGATIGTPYATEAEALAAITDDTKQEVRRGTVSPGPFVTDTKAWVRLAFKRMLIYAVENGFTSITWTTGKQQAERYKLSRVADEIEYGRNADGTFNIQAYKVEHAAEPIPQSILRNADIEEVAGMYGKDIAKIVESHDGGEPVSIPTEGLEVGGVGMRDFYDGIFVQEANDVLRKIKGPRIGMMQVDGLGQQPGFEIAPELAETVRKGLTLFSRQSALDKAGVARPQGERASILPGETREDQIRRVGQDDMRRFKVVQEFLKEKGVDLQESADVYTRENLSKSHTANKIEDFARETVEPLLKDIGIAKVSLDDIVVYLEARHIPEANERMRVLHKDPNATANGITDAQAQQVAAEFAAMPNFAEFKALADRIRAIADGSLDMQLAAGLISQEKFDNYRNAYSEYVPLRGNAKPEEFGKGRGLSTQVKGKRRKGHDMRGDEFILENILAARDQAIRQIENNKVSMAVLELLMAANHPDIGTIGKPVLKQSIKDHAFAVKYQGRILGSFETKAAADAAMNRVLSGANQQLMSSKQPGFDPNLLYVEKVYDPHLITTASPMIAENEIVAMVAGHEIRMQLNDPLLARAATKAGISQVAGIFAAARDFNQFLSKMYTQYSPDFMLTNMARDAYSALVILPAKEGVGFLAKTAANYPAAFKELSKAIVDPNASAWVKEWRDGGGNIGAAYMSDLDRVGDAARDALAKFQGAQRTYAEAFAREKEAGRSDTMAHKTAVLRAGKAGLSRTPVLGSIFQWISRLNAIIENTLRLATYMTAIESGMPKQKASMLSKDLMNFNRKGEMTNWLGAGYIFANPGIQGADIVYNALFEAKHKKQAWAMVGSLTALGFLMAEMLRGGGDEEEGEGERRRANTPDHVMYRNIVIPFGDKQVTIPVAYGWGFFHAMGVLMSDAVHGKEQDLYKASIKIVDAFLENFFVFGNPITDVDGEPGFNPFLSAPTALKTLGGPGLNLDSFGNPIMPHKWSEAVPDSESVTKSLRGGLYHQLAAAVNSGTGGNKYEPGFMDVSPNTLKYWVTSLTGGAGRFVSDSVTGVADLAAGVDTAVESMPIVRRFVREPGVKDSRTGFWNAKREVTTAAARFNRAKREGDHDYADAKLDKSGDLIELLDYANKQTKFANQIRDEIIEIQADGTLSKVQRNTMIRALEKDEKDVYDEFLRAFDDR